MCGIAGVLGTSDHTLLDSMITTLHHRGPDSRGSTRRRSAFLGATRLGIVHPDAGSQPLFNETKRACIVFNGEVYNHRQLRADLVQRGHKFTTETDGEVVLHLYEEMGRDCVRRMRGMFAFAILDGSYLLLGRDRLGIKPLYYSWLGDTGQFIFASELKALLCSPALMPRLNMQAFADCILLSHPTGPSSLIDGIISLPPGHTMAVSCAEQIHVEEPRPYYKPSAVRIPDKEIHEAKAEVGRVLQQAVTEYMDADVEVGLTLSGGLDSTLMAMLAAASTGRALRTFTVADNAEHPDLLMACRVAKTVGSDHRAVIISFNDFLEAVPRCVAAEGVPSSLSGVPFFILCSKIAECRIKSCLIGEGADELFGGYRAYLEPHQKLAQFRKGLSILKRLGVPPSDRAKTIVECLATSTSLDQYVQRLLEINLTDPLERLHLDPIDKWSMASSVEMRLPFLDERVVELVTSLPASLLIRTDLGIKKYLLRRLYLERFGVQDPDIVLREKVGMPSAGSSLREQFDNLCDDILPPDYLTTHELGYCFDNKRELFMFELFLDIFLKHRGQVGGSESVIDRLHSIGNAKQHLPSPKLA